MKILLRNSLGALAASVLAFMTTTIGWFTQKLGVWVYQPLATFSFTDNVNGRITPRPHYLTGNIFFLISLLLFFSLFSKATKAKAFIFFITSFLVSIIHPTSGVLLFFVTSIVYGVESLKRKHLDQWKFMIFGVAGNLLGLLLSYWSVNQYPYTAILAFESYVTTEHLSLSTIFGDLGSFGPIGWIGMGTLVATIFTRRGNKIGHQIMFFWLLVELLCFFLFYPIFRAERFRFLQTSYFIPMGYGATIFLKWLSDRYRFICYIFIALLALGIVPTYIEHTRAEIYGMTDYKNFSPFVFPTKKQMEAFHFLDTQTPVESTVIASWEAANLILLYSHNFVVGNTQGWSGSAKEDMVSKKDTFFRGVLSDSETKKYLVDNHIDYVYRGYQEQTGDLEKYSFLQTVFRNREVTIYQVK